MRELLCLFSTLCVMTAVKAAEIQLKTYKVDYKNFMCSLKAPDGQTLVRRISTQILLPKAKDKYQRENFSFQKPTIKKENDIFILSGEGAFRKSIESGAGIEIKADVSLQYSIRFAPTGKINAEYSYRNNGETFYFKPYLNVDFPYEELTGKEWELKNAKKTVKKGKWPEKLKHGLLSVHPMGMNKFKESHITAAIYGSGDKQIKITVPPEMQIRTTGGGSCLVYNYNYSSLKNKPLSDYSISQSGWTAFKAGESFSIKIDLEIPVSLKPLEKPDYTNAPRPEIKNGTFYYKGAPTFMLGTWLDAHYKDGNTQVPLKEYQDDRAYNHIFDIEVAKEKGFNTCHPQMCFWFTANALFPDSPKVKQRWRKESAMMFPDSVKGYKDIPLVVDFAQVGLTGLCSGALSKDTYQQNSRWHSFVPLCPESEMGRKIYKDYWQRSARTLLELGANPWIYELFNEPAYDCRCEPNKKAFIENLKKEYGSLEAVNKKWGSSFKSFEEIISNKIFERQKGLWVDWLKFIEERWCAILLEGKKDIREIDKRKNIYFSNQRAIAQSFLTTFHGFDEYKIARVLDMVNTEGGVSFYMGKALKDDDPMEAHQKGKMAMQLDLSRAAAEEKPVIDTEQSTKRFDESGKRIQSKASDLNLMLWNQAIHGASSTQIYSWVKRQWQWKPQTLEGAKKFILGPNKGWAYGALLNPYNFPKGSLDGIKDFRDEIAKLAPIVLPRPRIKGTVALLLSNPTKRYTMDITEPFTNYYNALSATHFPLDIIFEEQLPKGFASKYKAIISPAMEYSYPDTPKLLKEYVNSGGTLILQGLDLSFGEYGKVIDNNSFIGLEKRVPLDMPLPFSCKWKDKEIDGAIQVSAKNKDAEILLATKNIPLLTAKKYGKGEVFYMAFKAKPKILTDLFETLLAQRKINKPFSLRNAKGENLPKVEIQLIDRGKTKLYYFANWKNISELGVLSLELPAGKYALSDPAGDNLLESPSGEKMWSAEELKKGVKIFLKPEEKTLLLITEKVPENTKAQISQDEMEKKYSEQRKKDEAEALASLKRKEQAELEKARKNTFLDADKTKCFPVDISKHCNMAFVDEIEGDEKGGSFDQGADNDLPGMPIGKTELSNVPFHIIDPAKNNGYSMIVLRGRKKDFYPEKVSGIPVNKKVKYLYFLHTMAWDNGKFEYVVNYDDGSSVKVPIRSGKEIGGWWHPTENKAINAKIAWIGRNKRCPKIGAYCYRWTNPAPDKTVKSIDIVSFNDAMIPGIIAITAQSR